MAAAIHKILRLHGLTIDYICVEADVVSGLGARTPFARPWRAPPVGLPIIPEAS